MGRNLVDRLEENSLAFPEAATVQAAMVTAWFFMLRAKEYCNSNGVDEDIVLRGIDARFTKDAEVVEGKDANELTMQFRKTKTDQLGFGESKTLKATGEHHICPVEALVRMQRAWPTRFMKERGDSVRHLFRWANGVVLKRVEVQSLLQQAAKGVGLPPDRFMSHSLLIGWGSSWSSGRAGGLAVGNWTGNWGQQTGRGNWGAGTRGNQLLSVKMAQLGNTIAHASKDTTNMVAHRR